MYLQVNVSTVITNPWINAQAVVVANVHVNAELQDVALSAAGCDPEDCVGGRDKPELLGLQTVEGENLESCPTEAFYPSTAGQFVEREHS